MPKAQNSEIRGSDWSEFLPEFRLAMSDHTTSNPRIELNTMALTRDIYSWAARAAQLGGVLQLSHALVSS